MSTRKLWRATGFLCIVAAAAASPGSEGPASGELRVLTIPGCTIRFVNKSTYATARPGIIADLPFEEGDRVPAGSLIVRLRDEVAEANYKLRAQQAAITTAILIAEKEQMATSMELADKQKANKVYRASVPDDTYSPPFPQSEIRRLEVINEARILQVQQAEEELGLNQVAKEQAEAELETYRVHADFGGLVTHVEKNVGEAVNLGDEIMTIVDTSRVRVEGNIPYADARRLQVGDPVYIQLVLPEDFSDRTAVNFQNSFDGPPPVTPPNRKPLPEEQEVFTGRIGFIDVETKGDTGLVNEVRLWAEVKNRDNILLEGLPAVMKVQVRDR